MKKKLYLLPLLLLFLLGGIYHETFAETILYLPEGTYGGVLENNRITEAVESVAGSYNFVESIINVIFTRENIITLNVIIGIVAIIYLIVLGIKFIFSEGKEETLKNIWKQFGYLILGLISISVAQIAAFVYLNPDINVNPSFLVNQNVISGFEAKAMQIKLYIQILIGGLALLSIAVSAYQVMTSLGKDEIIEKEKQAIKNFILAAVLILSAEVLVRGVFFVKNVSREEASTQAVTTGIRELVGLTNALLTIIAALAVFMLILASFYYVISLGDEDRASRAKRLIISSIIGLIVALSAYTILHFFIGMPS